MTAQGFKQLGIHASIFISYILVWLGMWSLHFDALLIDTASLFFLPAGLRVTCFLLSPKKYWPTIILADISATAFLNLLFSLYTFSLFHLLLDNLLPTLVYLSFATVFLHFYQKVNFDTPQQTLVFLFGLISTALVYGLIKAHQMDSKSDDLPMINPILTFAFGDIMGVLICLLTVMTIRKAWSNKDRWRLTSPQSIMDIVIVSLIMAAVLYLPNNLVEMFYAKIVIIFTMIGIAYRHGLFGATVCIYIAAICIVLYVTMISDPVQKLAEQTLFVSLCALSLLLGSTVTQNKRYERDLRTKNTALKRQTSQLSTALANNRRLNQRIIQVQEEERRRLAKDLHDEIGQNMAAMRIEIKLLDALQDDAGKKILSQLKAIAVRINQTTHLLMNRLHPRGLSELGLLDAIQFGDVALLLKKSNIALHVKVKGDWTKISEELSLALYRIFQETASNTIKYANATSLSIELALEDGTVTFSLIDDGDGMNVDRMDESKGLGIIGIQERVHALNGTHQLASNQFGTQHLITIPLLD